jgi:serine protease AprX
MESGSRNNALWGRGGRRAGVATAVFACALVAATAAAAAPTGAKKAGPYVQESLASAIAQNPARSFDVVLEGDPRGNTQGFVKKALGGLTLRRRFHAIDGAQATLTGTQILKLEKSKDITAILPNEPVKVTSSVPLPDANDQKWAWVTHTPVDWTTNALSLNAPTIAVVDSGIDSTRADFAGRVLGQVNFYTGTSANSPGDGYGHGTFVAGIAAGAADGYAGVAPNANLLSLDVIGDDGSATVGDIVSACDWILANKATYNIRVVNLSLQGSDRASVFFDPLDQAVESLWLNGVVVVAASGNYGTDGQSTEVSYAPGNDPFVITVGASDINDTLDPADDTVAPWSAWGYTADGFAKPELAAPGRYLIGPVPANSGLATERPGNVVGDGLMQLSGTSFAAPMVAGAAALILARHPDWTPDQVKGALMVSAQATPAAAQGSLGVGELDVAAAREVSSPPNPNADLDQFVTTDSTGAPVFDSSAWQADAQSNAAWSDAAWSSAAWSSAAWSSAAWSSAAWSSAAWSSAAWSSAAWSSAVQSATDIGLPASPVTDDEKAAVEAQLGIADPVHDPTAP